jgi:thiosulfate/3-mercaptopyruvate sulfurtransferase
MDRRKLSGAVGVLLVLVLLPSALFSKEAPIKGLDRTRLIETADLKDLVHHPSVRIVDMRTSLPDYLKNHIPNALFLHFENLRIPNSGIPAQAPDRITLERLLGENVSVSNNMWVVLYSENSNPNATSLAWTLDFLGHKKVGVLNGGWEKWVSENHPTTQEYPSLAPKKFFGKPIGEALADKKWVQSHLSSKDVVIVDARSPRQYSGEEGEEIRRGHIPGARNLFWETTLEGTEIKTWKSKEHLQKLAGDMGIVRDKEIVVHCRTGREASHVYFTLKHVLGYPRVRLYRASWVEWSADRTLPVKTGSEP